MYGGIGVSERVYHYLINMYTHTHSLLVVLYICTCGLAAVANKGAYLAGTTMPDDSQITVCTTAVLRKTKCILLSYKCKNH